MTGAFSSEGHPTSRSRGARLLGWVVALGGAAGAVAVARELDAAELWLAVLGGVVVAVATALSGFLAGAVATVLIAGLGWWRLDEVADGLGVAIGALCGGLVVAALVASLVALRARERVRATWLDRLHRLAEELAEVGDDDPVAAVEAAARRATGAAGLRMVTGPGDRVDVDRSNGVVTVPATTHPGVSLSVPVEPAPSPDTGREHETFLRAVADHCGEALARVELRQAERRARDDLEFMARASAELSASLDVQQVAATIDALVVPYLADECTLRIAPRPGQRPEIGSAAPPDDACTRTLALRAHGEHIGDMTIRRAATLSPDELSAAERLAERAAQALAHALLFSEQVRTSSTLEHSLLPEAILPIPNLQVATRYLAAAEGHAAGGDFYDVLLSPAGAAILVVGDVQGKGVMAATLTSTARHTLRTAALGGAGPAQMLTRLNDALLYGQAERLVASGEPTVRFVTVTVASLTATATGFEAVVASGGHPPPLVIRPAGTVEHVSAEGPLLGVFEDPVFTERTVDLRLSDVLLLYSDGVTEQRQQPDLFDEAQLGRLVRNMLTARHADAVAQQILDTVVVVSPREVRDDIALVVARVTGPR